MRARILGCGSSGGVPRIGGDWGACDSTNPRNRRRRCSLLVTQGQTTILIDTSPDMREQLLDAEVTRLDAVFYTHAHADQAHGIDDLRMLCLRQQQRIPIHAVPETLAQLRNRFEYCFTKVKDYPPILDAHELAGTATIGTGEDEIALSPFEVQHGSITAQGFLIENGEGRLAYIPDVSDIRDENIDRLSGVEVLIVDALRYRPHPSHAHLDRTLTWIERIAPKHAILTNMHIDLDYETLRAELPTGVEPAFDGMDVTVG